MEFHQVKCLIEMVDSSKISSFEYATEYSYIKIIRDQETTKVSKDEIACSVDERKENGESEDKKENEITIKSKYVAIAKLVDNKNLKTYITTNKRVLKGEKLCDLQFLNLNIDVLSTVDGIIKNIFIKENDMVEYGTKLFSIEVLT